MVLYNSRTFQGLVDHYGTLDFKFMIFVSVLIGAEHPFQQSFSHNRTVIYPITHSSAGYSKTCVKKPLKNRQNKDLNYNW